MKLEGEVEPVLATYIDEGPGRRAELFASADCHGYTGRPGDSMKDIIQHILGSSVPVHMWAEAARAVPPPAFLSFERGRSGVAPGTRTGAAANHAIGGLRLVDETLRKKITNDAMAFLRSYSEKRGRRQAAETAVTDARAFTETERSMASDDYVAASPEELLRNLNGKTITRFDGTKTTLGLSKLSACIVRTRPAKVSRAHRRAGHVFLLLILGALGLYAEFTHPGAVVPGVVGGLPV
jgi:membrane-bound serine protease (ClpP class)